ncbi:MAG TPA: alanine--tRNA ligase [Actinomycetota bacterium]|nr:alanine--tRNA ligase [Actinomycetota bacterium]
MEGNRIRELFLAFFEERAHTRVRSSSLIPPPESGLLLTNAGMNQFIPYFLGQAEPPYLRAATSQKVMRTNDIENVGHDARHLTFFEMLGNFSFADYFKADAIVWAHELITQGYGIEHDRLWVTVYDDDDEAAEIWIDGAGLAPGRIVRRGKLDAAGEPANYWHTHAAGPAGPCSEIFVDRGPALGPDGGPDVDEERFMEIWNLVFIQDRIDGDLAYVEPLPAKNVDTGSCLERVALLLQGVDNVFETDLLRPILEVGERRSGRTHGDDPRDDVSLKVIAEHGRAATFLIADGVQPSNEGRGYVLRRMLRRVVSHARRLGIEGGITQDLITSVLELFGDAYPELRENEAFVRQVADSEEERFAATLKQGLVRFERAREHATGGTISGDEAFALHDTHGFPIELLEELAAGEGLSIDRERFEELLEEQRTRARAAAKRIEIGPDAGAVPPTEFVGYTDLESESPIALLLGEDDEVLDAADEGRAVRLVLDRTPFYAEGGGQIGDRGTIRTPTGTVRIVDTQAAGERAIVHAGIVESGEVRPGQEAFAQVDAERREATARAHTSTHVVHWTLKHLLGDHARQAGSLVEPGRLRFDFPNPGPVSRRTLEEAELEANRHLADDDAVIAFETTQEEARSLGAVALFGEKYGQIVRVVEIGDYSRELCGGTHVPRTGRVAVIRLLHEGSIGAGMRRVEALVGPDALREINVERELLHDLVAALEATDAQAALERARRVVEENKRLRSQLGTLRAGDRGALIASLAEGAHDVDGVALVVSAVPGEDPSGLRELAQKVRDKLAARPAVVVVGNGDGGKAMLVAAATQGAVERGVTAPAVLEPAAKAIGGGAGGKDILANAGGKDAGAIDTALGLVPARLRELLGAA